MQQCVGKANGGGGVGRWWRQWGGREQWGWWGWQWQWGWQEQQGRCLKLPNIPACQIWWG